MYKELLRSIEDIEIYPIISLVMFVLFFVGMFIWIAQVDKTYVDHMKNMPLNDEPQNESGHEKI
jgi:cbb3-type cytochrome oxidase subunit 3